MTKTSKNAPMPQCVKTDVSGSVIFLNDLRIGNKVYSCYPTKDKEMVDINYISKDLGLFFLTPIPLTEELLLKLGALKLDFKDFPSFNLFGMQINFINGLWIEYVSRVEIKGLHHLQNIFFFRNSEELQVGSLTDR